MGPTRERTPSLYTLLSLCGALGLAVQLVEDPQSSVGKRYTSRRNSSVHVADRISKVAVRKARPIVLSAAASKAAKARWAKSSPEMRAATVAMLNAARKAKPRRRAGTSEAA